MSTLVDITLPLDSYLPIWPGGDGFALYQVKELARDGCNETRFSMGSHVGTHVDAPKHFVADGAAVDQLPLEALIGTAVVADVGGAKVITAEVLETLGLPDQLERLLLKTVNSHWWTEDVRTFRQDFVALTLDGAEWLVRRGVRLVGIDYLSVQRYGDTNATHVALLEAGIVLLEGLNLASVDSGTYELICLPLPVSGGEGAPARAVLRRIAAPGHEEKAFGQ